MATFVAALVAGHEIRGLAQQELLATLQADPNVADAIPALSSTHREWAAAAEYLGDANSIKDTVTQTLWSSLWSSLCECCLSLAQQWCCLFEHGSGRRDRAHAVCIATRLVAGSDAIWRPSSSSRVSCLRLSETLWSSLCKCFSCGAVFSSTDWCVRTVHMQSA